jgi:hypothetical protein
MSNPDTVLRSSNGLFTLSVTDDGILLEGPGGRVTIDASQIVVQGSSLTLDGSPINLTGSPINLTGSPISLGGGLAAVARLGDPVSGGGTIPRGKPGCTRVVTPGFTGLR